MIDVDHDDTILRIFILFVQTARTVLKYADAHLNRKGNLSIIKMVVLRVLANNNGRMMPSEIAKWTQTERHNITALVDRMRKDGLVTTERNSSDKRLVDVILTDKGWKVLEQIAPVASDIVSQVMSAVSEDDAVPLEKSLRVLRQNAHDGLEDLAKRA